MGIQKLIIEPSDAGMLTPHWYELDDRKMRRLAWVCTRTSKFAGERAEVLASPPVLVTSGGYLINGKHRAATSVLRDIGIEAVVADSVHDLRCHVPDRCYGEGGLAGCIEALAHEDRYVQASAGQGVRTVGDLVRRYQALRANPSAKYL